VFFGATRLKVELLAESQYHRLQDLFIIPVDAAFSLRFKVAIEFQYGGIGSSLAVIRENFSDYRKNARFPINESAVAIEADGGETGKIHEVCDRFRR